MNTIRAILLTGFIVSIFWIALLTIGIAGEVVVDGITVSSVIVTTLAVATSAASWALFSLVGRTIRLEGLLISVIVGTALIAPFREALGPMAAIMVGIATGFSATMMEKRLTGHGTNRSFVMGATTLGISYAVLFAAITLIHPNATHRWDDGFGSSAISLSDVNSQKGLGLEYECQGSKLCLKEMVTRIVDGDTIHITGGHVIRLSLTNTPEPYEAGFQEATKFTADLCPAGSIVLVDQDDLQPFDVYDRMLGKVTCNGKNLNSELLYNGHANILKQYCTTSEFSEDPWAQEFGC